MYVHIVHLINACHVHPADAACGDAEKRFEVYDRPYFVVLLLRKSVGLPVYHQGLFFLADVQCAFESGIGYHFHAFMVGRNQHQVDDRRYFQITEILYLIELVPAAVIVSRTPSR